MSRRTKSWVVGMRVVQQGLRGLQLIGAVGILVLMILINNVDMLVSWVMRITVGLSHFPTEFILALYIYTYICICMLHKTPRC